MATITPTSNSRQSANCSSFKIGDLVTSTVDNAKNGTVTGFRTSMEAFVRWNDYSFSTASVMELRHS